MQEKSSGLAMLLAMPVTVSALAQVEMSGMFVMLPQMAHYFGYGTSHMAWVSVGYMLGLISALVMCGNLCDRLPPGKLLNWGVILFGSASLLCGVSTGLGWLVLARILQGIGGATMIAATYSFVPHVLPKEKWTLGYSAIVMGGSVGVAIGPVLGGLAVAYASWRWLFFINVPICLWLGYNSIRTLNTADGEDIRKAFRSFDWAGLTLNLAGLVPMVYALTMSEIIGVSMFWRLILLAGLFLTLFVMHEKRCPKPLLKYSILSDRKILVGNIIAFSVYFVSNGTYFIIPLYLQDGLGLSPQSSGFLLMLAAGISITTAFATAKVISRIDPARMTAVALLVCAAAGFWFSSEISRLSLGMMCLYLLALRIAIPFMMPGIQSYIMRAAPDGHEGSVTGMQRTFSALGSLFGISCLEMAFSWRLPPDTIVEFVSGHLPSLGMMQGWEYAFIGSGLAALVGGALMLRMLVPAEKPAVEIAGQLVGVEARELPGKA